MVESRKVEERPPEGDDRAALDLLIRGFQVSRLLRLVADLGLADRVPLNGEVEIKELAAQCGVQGQPLSRVLRALAAFRVFRISPHCRVAHTERSRLLRTDEPRSLHYAACFWAGPGSWNAWGRIDEAMTGGVPHIAAWGQNRFDYLRAHPEEARAFDAMMANFGDDRHAAVAQAYSFAPGAIIADIGGGNGTALRAILARNPTARGILFDRKDVVAGLGPNALLDGRITAEPGNFFERVPAGVDAYILMRVLHDWSDEDCHRILKRCRAAMSDKTVLLICDQVLEPDPLLGSPTDYLVDTQMMAMFGSARERTEEEFAGLLTLAGLNLRRVIATGSPVKIVEAGLPD